MQKFTFFLALFLFFSNTTVAQWQPTEGINGAEIRCNVTVGSNIFVGTRSGIYISNDNGNNWSSTANILSTYPILSLAYNGTTLFAGTYDGIAISTNNGNTWTILPQPDLVNVQSIAFSGTNIFVGTRKGVALSTDNGITWRFVNRTLQDVVSISISGTSIYAASSTQIDVSTDNGLGWDNVNSRLRIAGFTAILASGANLFVGTTNGMYLSNDNGLTWSANSLNASVYSLTKNGTTLYAGTNVGVFTSTNNSSSWTLKNVGVTKLRAQSVVVNGSNLVTSMGGRVYVSSNNGDNWTEKGFGLTDIQTIAFTTNGTNSYAGTSTGEVYLSKNNGANWVPVSNNLSCDNVFSLASNGTNVFASTNLDLISNFNFKFRVNSSNNNSSSWNEVNTGFPADNSGSSSNYVLATIGSTVFAGSFRGVYKSTNNGGNWTAVNNGIENWFIYALASDGAKLYATGYYFNPLFLSTTQTSGIFLSTDNGANWRQLSNSAFTSTSIEAKGSYIYAGSYDGGILMSENGGSSWIESNRGLTNLRVSSVVVSGSTVFASTYGGGVFYSTNNGQNWRAANEGLPVKYVIKLSISGNYLLAGTNKAVFRRALNEFSIATNTKENKDDFNCTISPNPVSNSLTINASNNLIGKKYAIKNILGETIKADILTNNSTELNVHNLANGIYFLHLIGTNKTVKFVKE
jgi:phage pi2 protein 07